MNRLKPKKFLGQHFLMDQNIARKIAGSLSGYGDYRDVLEIGPGTGALTRFLAAENTRKLTVIEKDPDALDRLREIPEAGTICILEGDVLKLSFRDLFSRQVAVIGNLPYNISSPVFFMVMQFRDLIPEAVFMIQKEVAQRIASNAGNKEYGILSVLLQAHYRVELLFKVPPSVFYPPPRVDSAVLRLQRKPDFVLACDEKLFVRLVKQGFQNRRKTLRNALKPINLPVELANDPLLAKRAEQLSVQDYVDLTLRLEHLWSRM